MGTRLEREIRREDTAQALGLSYHGYAHYERGVYAFTIDQLFTLSRVLGRSVEHFLGLETGLTDLEDELLALFRTVPASSQPLVVELVRAFKPKPPPATD
jgi:transcriptional regulator with XRE-family HTH domain